MAIQYLEDGGVLYTGEDAFKGWKNGFRDNYDSRDCRYCIHQGDEEYCEDCNNLKEEFAGCSCHINAPCSYCLELKFESSVFLINYRAYGQNRVYGQKNWRWECIASTENIFNKFKIMEEQGFYLDAELLSTEEVSINLMNDMDEVMEIRICQRKDFWQIMEDIIKNYKIDV